MTGTSGGATAPVVPDYNLVGQRLGRKGQETRERILCAALTLLEEGEGDVPITLTRVARAASVGLTTLYLYFPNLGDLLLAALQRTMEEATAAFVEPLRGRWPDDRLADCCLAYLRTHFAFWREHARILHLRNSFAGTNDLRFLHQRNAISRPMLDLLMRQMDDGAEAGPVATVLLSGFEGLAAVLTSETWGETAADFAIVDSGAHIGRLLLAEAQVMALAIADRRAAAQQGKLTGPIPGRMTD